MESPSKPKAKCQNTLARLSKYTDSELGHLGGPILFEIGVPYPESLLGSTEALGREIRKVLFTPSGEIQPPIAGWAYTLEQVTPITGDTDLLFKAISRLACVHYILSLNQ